MVVVKSIVSSSSTLPKDSRAICPTWSFYIFWVYLSISKVITNNFVRTVRITHINTLFDISRLNWHTNIFLIILPHSKYYISWPNFPTATTFIHLIIFWLLNLTSKHIFNIFWAYGYNLIYNFFSRRIWFIILFHSKSYISQTNCPIVLKFIHPSIF